MKNNLLSAGMVSGIIFCGMSAAFDVFVGNITQKLDPAIFIFYCFMIATGVFFTLGMINNGKSYLVRTKKDRKLLSLVNLAVMLNWGGLIVSLKFLEPAVVGIASVACGPALTIVISRYFLKDTSSPGKTETVIAWIILAGVIVMLANSYFGKSGLTSTDYIGRTAGIVSVLFSAVGTVLYTFFSRGLSKKGWKAYEILGFRNILMLLVSFIYCIHQSIPLLLENDLLLIVVLLSVVGHIIPVFLIQKSISELDPIHVSLLLLLLPVFTLAFQFTDSRIVVSWESISAVLAITCLLIVLCVTKVQEKRRGSCK